MISDVDCIFLKLAKKFMCGRNLLIFSVFLFSAGGHPAASDCE